MTQLGISAFYHDSAACLVIDGKVIAAAEEERFTEIKHDDSFPVNAIAFVLSEAGIQDINEIDEVCWYEKPEIKKDRVLKTFNKYFFKTLKNRFIFLYNYYFNSPKNLLRRHFQYRGLIRYTDHHLSHAAFSYLTSPYKNAAILTVDGVGEWETITISRGIDDSIQKIMSINFPHSLGMLYSTVTAYLGFKPNEGEYKVMGLAPFGNSKKYYKKLNYIFTRTSNKFEIDQKYFTWEYSGRVMFNYKFAELLNLLPRLPEEPITQDHKDLAAALQKIYEDKFEKLLITAKNISKSPNIVLGGGCAYNGVANVLGYKYFRGVYVPFAPSDAGSAIGACLYNYLGKRKDNSSPYLGNKYTNGECYEIMQKYKSQVKGRRFFKKEKLAYQVAKLIDQQNIVAWFQGSMEFGARALGNRSILASPRDASMRDKLNRVIKKREGFRPFAPSVTAETASRWFELKQGVPYMNIVVKARTDNFQAATHIDGTCRVQTVNRHQNPLYYLLLKQLGKVSGSEVVLNTSYNLKDQTITRTPEQAIERFINSDIDYLVLNNILISKR